MLCAGSPDSPIYAHQEVGRSGSASSNSQDPGNGSILAGILATFEFCIQKNSPDPVGTKSILTFWRRSEK